jgi:hypothetical protein
MPANGESVKDTAFRGVEALQTIITERDKLLRDNDRMLTDCAMLREQVAQMATRIATLETERDHYMRFSTELVTKLNNVQMIIEDAIRSSKAQAFRPALVPVPKTEAPEIDTSGIERLIKRLPANGGESAKAK